MNSGRMLGVFLLIAFMALAGAVAMGEEPTEDTQQHTQEQSNSTGRPAQEKAAINLRALQEKVSACINERGGRGGGGTSSLAGNALAAGASGGRRGSRY